MSCCTDFRHNPHTYKTGIQASADKCCCGYVKSYIETKGELGVGVWQRLGKEEPDGWACDDCGRDCTGLDWCPACAEKLDSDKAAEIAEEAERKANHAYLTQVGGDHYIKYMIQPFDIIDCYNLNFYAGNALKYLLRYRDKDGILDLKKAQHYIQKLIENEVDASAGEGTAGS